MPITLKTQVPVDIFSAIQEQVQKAPALVKRGLPRVTNPINKRMLAELQAEPGKPRYPIRWKSAKQRRAFFATNGFGRGIPTRRTGDMVKRWTVKAIFSTSGGEIIAANSSPYSQYVQGDDAQPFHLDTDWPQAAPIFVKYAPIYEDALIEFWFTIADPLAGIPKGKKNDLRNLS